MPSPRVVATSLQVVATVSVLLVLGFLNTASSLYRQIAPYDDEGYLQLTVDGVLSDAPLYDNVHSQYGPAWYLLEAAVHKLIPNSHSGNRLETLLIWLLSAAAAGFLL